MNKIEKKVPNFLILVACQEESYTMLDEEKKNELGNDKEKIRNEFQRITQTTDGELEKIAKQILAERGSEVTIKYIGVGMNNASYAATKLLSNSDFSFTHVLSVGSCGSVDAHGLNLGDIMIPTKYMNLDLDRRTNPQPHHPEEKLTLGQNTNSLGQVCDDDPYIEFPNIYDFSKAKEEAKRKGVNIIIGGMCGSTNTFPEPNNNFKKDPNGKNVDIVEMEAAAIALVVKRENAEIEKYNLNNPNKQKNHIEFTSIKAISNGVEVNPEQEADHVGDDWIKDLEEGKTQKQLAFVTKLIIDSIIAHETMNSKIVNSKT